MFSPLPQSIFQGVIADVCHGDRRCPGRLPTYDLLALIAKQDYLNDIAQLSRA